MSDSSEAFLRPRRAKILGLLTVTGLLAAAGVGMIAEGLWLGWLIAPVFGLGVLVSVLLLLPNSAYLEIRPGGFTVCSLFRKHSYRWSDVESFETGFIGINKMVVFNYSARCQGATWPRKLAVAISGFEGALPDSYGMRAEALAELLNQHRAYHLAEVSEKGVRDQRATGKGSVRRGYPAPWLPGALT
jgi:hypothetical protein